MYSLSFYRSAVEGLEIEARTQIIKVFTILPFYIYQQSTPELSQDNYSKLWVACKEIALNSSAEIRDIFYRMLLHAKVARENYSDSKKFQLFVLRFETFCEQNYPGFCAQVQKNIVDLHAKQAEQIDYYPGTVV